MARKTKLVRHDAEIRERIKIGMIIDRLNKHLLGEIELSRTQVQAANILIRKVLPDLAQIDHRGDGGGPFIVEIRRFGRDKPDDPSDG